MSASDTRRMMNESITSCPEFNYAYTPEAGGRTRYVFDDKVCMGLTNAYEYVIKLATDKSASFEGKLKELAKQDIEDGGQSPIEEMDDISWVYGPNVQSRHYRVTFKDERVMDFKVIFSADHKEVIDSEMYNEVI